jgi:hypothetical protein
MSVSLFMVLDVTDSAHLGDTGTEALLGTYGLENINIQISHLATVKSKKEIASL